jgi:hypothetical protein
MRRAAPCERAALALRLSDEVIALSRRAIARSFSELDDEGQRLKFVELQYGRELAERLRRWLSVRGRRA